MLPGAAAAGVLASKYGHDASELGGPVTEALQQAQLSTRARVQDLEGRTKAMHRCEHQAYVHVLHARALL